MSAVQDLNDRPAKRARVETSADAASVDASTALAIPNSLNDEDEFDEEIVEVEEARPSDLYLDTVSSINLNPFQFKTDCW